MVSIKSITLQNFKSFRGETIIDSIQPFTVITGPNGSGKSNIMDAVRFVLGEQSSALRVKCLGELVNGAAIGKSTMEDTYVAMILTIDDEEKNFTRMIHGKNSQYKINNKIVSYNFYTTELRKLHLDIKLGNFLVPQDYIECIALKSPKELTALLEQICGSDAYKADYDRLKLKLQKAEGEIQFVRQIKKELLKTKDYALKAETEAIKYSELQKQYMKEKTEFQLLRLLLIKKVLKTLQDKERTMKSRIDEQLIKKNDTMSLLRDKELQLKPLSNFLENVQLDILKLENAIQEKKIEHVASEQTMLYWQKKYDCAHTSLGNANKAYGANKKSIQELESELEKINIELMELREIRESEENIELSNSQIERYMCLKTEVENRVKNNIMEINDLMRNQQTDRDTLDNHNRHKQDLEDKAKRLTLMKQNLEEQLKKLRDLNAESEATIIEMTIKKQELIEKIAETKIKSSSLENDITKISEELDESDIDDYMISRKMKKAKIINTLKQSFSGVYDRLSNLCKPIHERYNIAVVKVFNKQIDNIVVDTVDTAKQCIQFLKKQRLGVETFLPLDSIKTESLKERLRSIQELRNVKLLYDVLDIPLVEVRKAVLFVTKNTLVCETAKDASKMAYEIGPGHYDCVSLDGCFYRKSGLISGGQADLIAKAKQWGDQQVAKLKERKAQLVQELKDLPIISRMQSELNVIADVQIKGITLKHNYMENDIKDIDNKIAKVHQELNVLDTELLSKLNTITKQIQRDMQEKNEKIKDVKRHINIIEDDIFANFCEDINVPNISYFEKTNLRTYQEQKKRQLKLEEQKDRIKNQLCFERECDVTSKINKWKLATQKATTELNNSRLEENFIKIAMEQQETQLSELNDKRADIIKNIKDIEKDIVQYKLHIYDIEKSYMNSRATHVLLQKNLQQKKTECNTIFKECKIENINIQMLPEAHSEPRDSSNVFRSGSNLQMGSELNSTNSSNDWETLIEVNFSKFPDNIRNNTEDELQDIIKQLDEKLEKIQNEIKAIKKPNLKAHEMTKSITQEIREANEKLKKLHNESNNIKAQFETVKMRRYKLFSECMECIVAEIDSVYKGLLNDSSAQAFIIPENLEEPYIGGINYSCIPPFKQFQPIQYLSGGEKSLASLALLFAIQRFKLTPFFMMDESDAALDKKNVKNMIRFIRSQANTTQFIIITCQNQLKFSADVLVGVTTDPDAQCPESNVFAISLHKYKA